jgi:1-acyl-sn-glycerol-3-phosphate acyltransferase
MDEYRAPLRFRLSRPVLRTVFRGIFRILGRVKITGRENVPFGRPYVVAINHVSIFDPPFAASFWPETLEIIGASDVFDKPGQGQLLKWYGVTPVHRGDYDRALLEWMVRVVKSGKPLLIAPEGGRSHVTAMQRAKPGIAYLVDATRVPVLPVGLVGTTDDYWQRARRGEKPMLEMRIGKPISLPLIDVKNGAARREARQQNTDLVMRHMAGLLPEEYRGVYAESAIAPS